MIGNNGCFGLCGGYAQTGWLYRYSDGTRWSFWQWTHDDTYTTFTASPNGVNGFDRYMTLYNNTPGKFTFQVDSTVLDLEPAQWTPNEGQYASEILNQANQMPGDRSINQENTNTNIWYNGGWHAFYGSLTNSNTNLYGSSQPSGGITLFSWDKACAS